MDLESGEVFYGRHFSQGVCYYPEDDCMVLVPLEAAKKMDETFKGKPVFVGHKDKIDREVFLKAQGYVVKSFYNKLDGCHWAEFILTDKESIDKVVNSGWKLSNAYYLTESSKGGVWHEVEYQKKIIDGVYEHLAIVDNPRYNESIILTPQDYKEYNAGLKMELDKLENSKEDDEDLYLFEKDKD